MYRPRLIQAKIALGRIQLVLDPHEGAGLKPGDHLYPYVTDSGALGSTAALLDRAPDDPTSYDSFFADNQGTFEIDRETDHEVAREAAQRLRGTRLQPCYVDVTRVKRLDDQLLVEGMPHGLYDPRLPYLDASEGTSFGAGSFNVADVRALWDGGYCYIGLSPMADLIAATVDRQRRAFDRYAALADQQDPGHRVQLDALTGEIESTRRLLKPHAHEIYRYADDTLWFINGLGNWQAWYVPGLRTIDHHDRLRLARLAGQQDPEHHRAVREQLHMVDIGARHRVSAVASLVEPEVRRRFADDVKLRDQKAARFRNLKPHDGPLKTGDLPGLKPGTQFFPHQGLLLAAIEDERRALGDADPGAGKALMIISDALRQLGRGTIKRPLVVMPNSLLAQFAREVKQFSELNPWIISTDAIARWSQASVARFLHDAHATPPNTIFLTSYDWLARDAVDVPNGEISGHRYRTHKVFPRPALLLDEVGIDGVYLDEVHLLKNESLRTWATTLLGRAPVVRGFTGTIMPGNLIDVTGPMGVIHSGILGSTDDFLDRFSPTHSVNDPSPDAPKQIRQLLADFGTVQIRKSAWADLLPKVHHQTHFVSMTKNQLDVYESVLTSTIDSIRSNPELGPLFDRWQRDDPEGPPPGLLLEKFVPLEKFINAPGHSSGISRALMVGTDLIGPKARLISRIAGQHLERRQGKVLVFCQYKEAAQALLDQLDPQLHQHAAYYDGGHVDQLQRFKDPDSDLRILVAVDATIRAGHNIQAANCIIHADLVWLAGDLDQREARAARIGQRHEVWIHTILTNNSIEVLKYARLLAAQHLVAKANSDFEDRRYLRPLTMSLAKIKTFKTEQQLKPYLERRDELLRQQAVHAERDKKIYGTSMLKPAGHTPIAKRLPGSQAIEVPSTDTFDGHEVDQESELAEELDGLPTHPRHPRNIEFELENRDDSWFLTCFRSVDPQGFLRRLGFVLERNLWYLEVSNRDAGLKALDRLEGQGFDLGDRREIEESIRQSRWVRSGHRGILKQLEQKDRQSVKGAAIEARETKETKSLVLGWSTIDGYPYLWTNVLDDDEAAVKALRQAGFQRKPDLWSLRTNRSRLKGFLRRLTTRWPEARLARWPELKQAASKAFKVDLSEFDESAK